MLRVLDEAGLDQAVTATFEEGSAGRNVVRYLCLRPHQPAAYYAAQEDSIVLTFDALTALVELAERNGWRRGNR